MTRFTVTPNRCFDRPWRSGHPFQPRCGVLRRVVMVLLLIVFALIIGGYNYLTDARRVRSMAEGYLSDMIGGKVEVRSATLSIFEGMRLDDVRVYVDRQGNKYPDSLIFSAQSFVLKYDPRTLLAGELDANQIIAQKPHVHLTESLDHPGEWNFQRLGTGRPRQRKPRLENENPRPIPLPEVLLRNAQVEISEVRGARKERVGQMFIDGQLTPIGEANRYAFEMQGHDRQGAGPYAKGEIALNTQELKAELQHFDFSRDLRSMLPADVRDWWNRHALGGQIDRLKVDYSPPRSGKKSKFRVEMQLKSVAISVPPEDWMSAEEARQLRERRKMLGLMQDVYGSAGFRSSAKNAGASAGSDSTLAVAKPGSSVLDKLTDVVAPAPIRLKDGQGRFVFTETGIQISDVTGLVENNAFVINGHIDGYGPDAPASLTIRSKEGRDVYIPPNPRWANSLPKFVRNIYQDIRPTGYCRLTLQLDRPVPGSAPVVSGRVDITHGEFCYRQFPYPVREASGTIAFGPEPGRGGDFVKIINFRGRGIPGGPNENMFVVANGEIGPLGPEDPEVKVIVTGKGLSSEPALQKAYPHEISDALGIFDADKRGEFPQYRGSFRLTLLHHAETKKWTFDTDVDLDDASGKLVGFPYLLRHVKGKIKVHDGYVDILEATMHEGKKSMNVSGRVVWGEGPDRGFKAFRHDTDRVLMHAAREAVAEPSTKIDLKVSVHGVPIDSNLVSAIPAEHAIWIKKLGLGGTIDVEGRVLQGIPYDSAMLGPCELVFPRSEPRLLNADPEAINFDLGIALRGGTFWPADGTFSVSNVSGNLHLNRDGMVIEHLQGTRQKSTLTADGVVTWAGENPKMRIHATGKDLLLDSALYAMLPEDARGSWDEVQPKGALDADVTWSGELSRPGAEPHNTSKPDERLQASALIGSAVASADDQAFEIPQSQPMDLTGFHAVLHPKGMTCTIKSLPYRLDGLTGTIAIGGGHVVLNNINAHHGDGTLTISGAGALTGARPVWNLRLKGTSITLNDEFRNAVPPTLQSLIDSIKLHGKADFDFPKLVYRGEGSGFGSTALTAGRVQGSGERKPGATSIVGSALADAEPLTPTKTSAKADPTNLGRAATLRRSQHSALSTQHSGSLNPEPRTLNPSSGPDLDLTALVTLHDASMDAGVPMEKVAGTFHMQTAVREGKLSKLDGDLNIANVTMAGRNVTDFHAELKKPENSSELNLDKMQAKMAGGQMAGQLHMMIADEGPSHYTLGLVLRNADVKTLVGEADKDIRGQLTASISLEGAWGEASMRRGRGDVTVSGRELYKMPLLLGLLQVTNLSLPIGSPFNQGLARYNVDGERINFERVDLKSDNMMMTGTGHLDFAKKQVQMTFTTDNPAGFKIPFINDIWQGARQELFKVSIRGSIQQPRVEANPFGTFTTTIDEVLKGEGKK